MGVVALVLVMSLLAMACLLAGVADCELVAEQQQQQQRTSSRVVVGLLPSEEEHLKSSESRISEEFESWIRHLADGNKEEENYGGMLAEEKDRRLLNNLRHLEGTKIESTRKSKTGRSHHVKQAADVVVESIDQLHEKDGADIGVPEQGGGGSWGEIVTAAVTAQPLMQQHAKEDGQDQSYQSGPSVEVVKDKWEIITSSLLRTDVVKFSNGTELQLFPSSEPIHKQVNETREDWVIFSSAHHALAVTEHAAGVSPLPAVTTSGATSGVFHSAFVHLSLSPALAMDAPAEEESSRCLGR